MIVGIISKGTRYVRVVDFYIYDVKEIITIRFIRNGAQMRDLTKSSEIPASVSM